MPLVLHDVAVTIQGDGFGTLGVDLFEGELPDTPDLCVALLDAGGGGPQLTLGDKALWDETIVQVLIRAAAQNTARTRAEVIYQAFLDRYSVTLNGTGYLCAVPIAPVSLVDRDAEDRPLFAINLRCWRLV